MGGAATGAPVFSRRIRIRSENRVRERASGRARPPEDGDAVVNLRRCDTRQSAGEGARHLAAGLDVEEAKQYAQAGATAVCGAPPVPPPCHARAPAAAESG